MTRFERAFNKRINDRFGKLVLTGKFEKIPTTPLNKNGIFGFD